MIMVYVLAALALVAAVGAGITTARDARSKVPTVSDYDTRHPHL